jgi:hypothetical protein
MSFHLAGNGFTGAFPQFLEGCDSLVILDISNNRFFGGIPAWIGSQVPSLRILSLRSNNFTGEIPSKLSQLSLLQLLDMANNCLTGSIPVAFSNLTTMKNDLPPLVQARRLSGFPSRAMPSKQNEFPDKVNISWKGREQTFWKTIGSIRGIDVSCNQLSGDIPEEITYLQGLRFLNLSRNNLSGSIPKKIGSLVLLEFLDLSCNELSRAIPPSISNLLSLGVLNLSNNRLQGSIPTGNQLQTLIDPSIYGNNPGLCGFPLSACEHTLDERTEGHEDLRDTTWLCYSAILGVAFGFWLWFGALSFVQPWRFSFLRLVDGLGIRIVNKMAHA